MEGLQMHEMTPERRQLSVSRPPASIENTVPSVARRLDELSRLAVAANRHEVWTAAIEMRLAQLAEERRWREAAAEAIVAAKQRELEFLEQQQEVGQEEEQGRTPPSVQQPQRQAGAWAAGEDPSLPSPLASPLSRTG
ncbi:hypothetical protein ABPG77_008604 [Micractinium sp. CCAP 211/92]